METVRKGLRRRGRLLAEALRPPTGSAGPRSAGGGPRPGAAGARQQAEPQDSGPEAYVAPRAPRLVESPVFVLSSVRSGSTLLRVVLNSHSRIRAPHEMHLRTLGVRMERDFTAKAMRELELDRAELEHLLWDRVLHLELQRSGKQLIVDKTPANTHIWPRLHRAWPEAKYLVLLRHPAAVVSSLVNRRADPDMAAILDEVGRYAEDLEDARRELGGHVLTYEDLTAEPERVTREICAYLGVEWEAGMLDYGTHDHGAFRPHIGDWSETIKSGRIQPARRHTEADVELPPRLQELAKAWGYED